MKRIKELSRIGKACRRGLINEETGRQEVTKVFLKVFMGLFSDHHLELRINNKNYSLFAKEFQAYQNGTHVPDPDHMPWLYDHENGSCEAAEYDQRQFFDLMERFHVTPEFFEPAPDGIPAPDIVPVHQYRNTGVYGTHFHCINSEELLSEEHPAGKTFRLRNELGQEAVLTIKEDRRTQDREGMDWDEIVTSAKDGPVIVKADFLAEGHIEGYTAIERTCNPEILIRLNDKGGTVGWLAYWSDNNDWKARNEYPLWQAYYDWLGKKEEKGNEIIGSIFNEFMQMPEMKAEED